MSDATRAQALDKLARMGEKVGYPDRWRDYSRLRVSEGTFVLNVARANAFEWQRTVNRPGTPVDTTEWGITVSTVNAYYDPTKNEMVFPAGALMPQTLDASAYDGASSSARASPWIRTRPSSGASTGRCRTFRRSRRRSAVRPGIRWCGRRTRFRVSGNSPTGWRSPRCAC